MKWIKIAYKITALVLLSIVGLILMGIFSPRGKTLAITKRQKRIRQWWLRKVISIVGLKLRIKGDVDHKQPALWVANHVSWLDIPVVGSEGAAFLSKAEVRKWPAIGWLGEKGGTVYIKRGGKNASQNASRQIAITVNGGDNMLIFPEGTTSDGNGMRRFHARIFAPAIDYKLPVQPIVVRYIDADGKPHPNIDWGDESFMTNLLGILGGKKIYAELTFLPIISGNDFSQRKRIAEQAENAIKDVLEPELPEEKPLKMVGVGR